PSRVGWWVVPKGGAVRLTRRGRVTLGAVVAILAIVTAARLLSRGDGLVRPDDPCTTRPVMQTFRGVTLQPVAMTAFKHAQATARGQIDVVESYRSCSKQAIDCQRICGDSQGCPGRCVRPGTSYHQLGAAIDISQ